MARIPPAEVREVRERLLGAALRREPPRRLFDGEQAERHEARGDELEAERDAPHGEPALDVQADPHYRIIPIHTIPQFVTRQTQVPKPMSTDGDTTHG